MQLAFFIFKSKKFCHYSNKSYKRTVFLLWNHTHHLSNIQKNPQTFVFLLTQARSKWEDFLQVNGVKMRWQTVVKPLCWNWTIPATVLMKTCWTSTLDLSVIHVWNIKLIFFKNPSVGCHFFDSVCNSQAEVAMVGESSVVSWWEGFYLFTFAQDLNHWNENAEGTQPLHNGKNAFLSLLTVCQQSGFLFCLVISIMQLCSAPREQFMISQQQLCQQPLVFFPVHLFFCQQVACPTFVEQIYLYNWDISQMLTNYSAAAQDCPALACLPLKFYVLLWSVPCWLPWAASYISTQDFR